jgi:hypothetical protein
VRPSWKTLHERAVSCADRLKDSYKDMLKALIEIEDRQIYFQLEVTSLYSYCVDLLGLPPHTSYDFIDVIRTSKTVPELAEAILQGRTTVSKARRVCSVITPENQKGWIDLVSECSHRIVQKCVAMANPKAAVPETMTYLSGDVLKLQLAVSEEWGELLGDVKDLMSQQKRRAVSTEEALFLLMSEFKRKNDPVEKAKRALARQEPPLARKAESTTEASTAAALTNETAEKPTRYRPRAVECSVDLRDLNRCTHVDRNGKRCNSRRWLEKHHIKSFADGGTHSLENLETLCAAHHRMRHSMEERAGHFAH